MALTLDASTRDSGFLPSKASLRSTGMVVDKPVGTSRGEQASSSKPDSQIPQPSLMKTTRRQKPVTEAVPEPEVLFPAKCVASTIVPRAASTPVGTPSCRPAHRVRFAEGPLREALGKAGGEVTEDGHPNHEGQVAERRRELHAVFSEEAVTKHSMRLMEVILGEENAASVQRLKRRFGLCPPAPRHLPYVTHPKPPKASSKPPLSLPGDAKVPIMAKVPRIVFNGSNSPNRSAGLRKAAHAVDTKAANGSCEKGKAASAREEPSTQGNSHAETTKPQGLACSRRPPMQKPKRLPLAGVDESSVRNAWEVQSSGEGYSACMSGSVLVSPAQRTVLSSAGKPACSGSRVTRSQSLRASASAQGGEEVQSRGEPAQKCGQAGLQEEMQGVLEGLLEGEGSSECEGIEDTSKRKAEVDVGDLLT